MHLHDITKEVAKAKIIHIHGVYSPYTTIAALICWILRKKYIISPHGGLRPAARKKNAQIKKLYDLFIQKHVILNASGLHVFSSRERQQLYQDYKADSGKVFIIPNGVESKNIVERPIYTKKAHQNLAPLDFAYIGRFSEEKNIDTLCRSFNEFRRNYKGAKLTLYGPESNLKEALRKKYNSDNIIFCPPVYGNEKNKCIDSHEVFIVPSLTEGMPITALEIFARGKILIASYECNLQNLSKGSYAIFCNTDKQSIVESLIIVANKSNEELQSVKTNAWELAKNFLTWKTIAIQYKLMYEQVGMI